MEETDTKTVTHKDYPVAIIYHEADLDGQVSGYLAFKYAFDVLGYKDTVLYPFDYGKDQAELMKEIAEREARIVIMTDFSLDPVNMRTLYETAYEFIWIDHHKSAIEENKKSYLGVREVGFAACELAWNYFFGLNANGDEQVTPKVVRHVGRYDVWDHSDPITLPLQYGLRILSIDITDFSKRRLLEHLISADDNASIDALAQDGGIAIAYDAVQAAEVANSIGFTAEYDRYKFVCLNNGQRGSMQFVEIYNPKFHDAMVAFRFNGRMWNFSVYTEGKFDCAAFAQTFGGGGHKGAAGFTLSEFPEWLHA